MGMGSRYIPISSLLGFGVWEKVGETVLTAAAASISFSPSAGFAHFVCLAEVIPTDNTVRMFLRFNDDAGANYSMQLLDANAAAVGAGSTLNATSAQILAVITTAERQQAVIFVDNTATQPKSFISEAGAFNMLQLSTGRWNSNNLITKITLLASTSTYAAGTKFTVYGVK